MFDSDSIVRAAGFLATVSLVCPPGWTGAQCDQPVLQNTTYSVCGYSQPVQVGNAYLTSPNYPNNYANNLFCTFVIQTLPQYRVQLQFLDFHVERSTNCNADAVKIFDGSSPNGTLLAKYCGISIPSTQTTLGPYMTVQFITDSSATDIGFRARWTSRKKHIHMRYCLQM